MNNLFKTKFDAAVIVLIPACIGINYLGKLFASVLKLPLWLDSIGTCIGAVLGGPIIGAVPKQRATIEALGLKKMHKTVEMPDNGAVRGMIQNVRHLVKVEEI